MKPTKKKIRPFFQESIGGTVYYQSRSNRSWFLEDDGLFYRSCSDAPVNRSLCTNFSVQQAKKRWPEIFKSELPE